VNETVRPFVLVLLCILASGAAAQSSTPLQVSQPPVAANDEFGHPAAVDADTKYVGSWRDDASVNSDHGSVQVPFRAGSVRPFESTPAAASLSRAPHRRPLFPCPVYETGAGPYSVAIGDFDGDGLPDLVVTNRNSTTVSVLRNRGDGTFAAKVDFVTGLNPSSVAIGDLEGDGLPDLVVTNWTSNTVSVLRNTSSGGGVVAFAVKVDFATGSKPQSVAIGDLDGDGRPDLAVVNQTSNTVSVLRNTSSGDGVVAFAVKIDFATGSNPQSVAIGDVDGDGRPDLAVVNQSSNTVSVLRNTSSGGGVVAFAEKVDFATGSNPQSVAIGDLDGDELSEIAVANSSSNTVSVLRNMSSGESNVMFAAKVDFATGWRPFSVAIGDLNRDGHSDLAVANANADTLSVLRNTSSGQGDIAFAAKRDSATGLNPSSVAIGDLDGDGKSDIAVSNSHSNNVGVLRNISSGGSSDAFASRVDYDTHSGPWAVAIGDLDGDGLPDLAGARIYSDTVSVVRNVSSGGGNIAFGARADFATGSGPGSVAIGDLNGDGRPDLVVANRTSNTVSVLRNLGNGEFANKVEFATGIRPLSIAIGDLGGDGLPDLAVVNWESNTVSVLRNTSSGASSITFAAKADFATGFRPFAVAIGDLNGDGSQDLVAVNATSATVSVLRNTSSSGSGIAFAAKVDFDTGWESVAVAIGDVDGDGRPDLAVANTGVYPDYAGTVSVLRNISSGESNVAFAAKVDYAAGYHPSSVAIGDLDEDGLPDLAVANAFSSTASVLRNTSSGVGSVAFAAKVAYATGDNPRSVAICDIDGDGHLDLVVPDSDTNFESVGFLRNQLGEDPCPVDLNGDGQVDDADFVIFLIGYNILDCADPAMPPRCPANLNADSFVDDADFILFLAAYNELLCP